MKSISLQNEVKMIDWVGCWIEAYQISGGISSLSLCHTRAQSDQPKAYLKVMKVYVSGLN